MKRHLWIVAVSIAALGVGWWLGRGTAHSHGSMAEGNANADAGKSDATPWMPKRPAAHAQSGSQTNPPVTPKLVPPPDTPLKQIFDELKTRADAGDADAASRLYRDLQRCYEAESARKSIAASTQQSPDADSEANIASAIESQRNILSRRTTLCDGLAPTQLEWRIPAMLRAAQLGDIDASDCYLSPGGLTESPELSEHPEWLSDFRENALAIADKAIERGDWIMVMQLAHSYLHGHYAPMFGEPIGVLWQATGQNDVLAYRYYRLGTLGVLDNENAKGFKDSIGLLGQKLSAAERAAADEWAQRTFLSFFFNAHAANDAYSQIAICKTD